MQFQKVHLLRIFRPLFRMQSNLHCTLVVIPDMCVCMQVCLRVCFAQHPISFNFFHFFFQKKNQMRKKKFRKNRAQLKQRWKIYSKYSFQVENLKEKMQKLEDFASAKSDAKLKNRMAFWQHDVVCGKVLWIGILNFRIPVWRETHSHLHRIGQ